MADDESADLDRTAAATQQDRPRIEFHGGKAMSALPIVFFVVWAIVQSALFRIGDTSGLAAGMLIGLIVGMLFVKGDWSTYASTIFSGMTQLVAATAIVAWLWAGMFASTMEVGGFVEGLLGANPVLLFGAILSGAVFGDNLATEFDGDTHTPGWRASRRWSVRPATDAAAVASPRRRWWRVPAAAPGGRGGVSRSRGRRP